MGLIVAGERSGVGKTTVTLAILACLAAQDRQVQSFKVGPDYIDPMFHSAITGLPCRNLDPVLTSETYISQCFARHTKDRAWALVEGVMGLFDGIYYPHGGERNDCGSTAHIARILSLPVVLVLDCSRLSTSIAAIASGYANLDPQVNVVGTILNQVASDRHLQLLTTALASIDMPILGVLRRNTAVTIPDRHLGLVPSAELSTLKQIFANLADLAATSFDWQKLAPLIAVSPFRKITVSNDKPLPPPSKPLRIAVARDKAFNFYYQDNLDLLTQLGAELIFWSPLEDRRIPDRLQGLYFGGGFPEMFASQLAENEGLRQELQRLISSGLPTYAECGGLMYLCQQLIDLQGKVWPMVGIIPSTVTMQAKLTLGYRQAIALQDSLVCAASQTFMGHEFHRSKLITNSPSPQWQLKGVHKSSKTTAEGWNINRVHASYLHLHWGANPSIARRFIEYCRNYKTSLY